MLPNDVVWDRIVTADAQHLKEADRRLGLQIRFRHNTIEYNQINSFVNGRILKCGIDNDFLPRLIDGNGTMEFQLARRTAESSKSEIQIFVASLFTGFADFANEQYIPNPKLNGEEVRIVQLSHEMSQTYGLEVDRQSLTEIMMLSFCDDLLVTPLSTFGGLAQAYGNLVPWIVEFRQDDSASSSSWPPCQRGQTVDVCYQEADPVYSCPYDRSVDKKRVSDVVPYVQKCLEIDAIYGLQLLTKNTTEMTDFPLTSDSTFDLLA